MLIPSKHSGYRAGVRLYPGGKGSSAPAPDERLIAGQLKSMGIQDDAIQRMLANSESMMPLQREQMQFGLDTSRKAYDQSQDDRQWMLGKRNQLSGVQDTMINDAKSFNLESRQNELAGMAGADVSQAFSNASGQLARSDAREGRFNSGGAAARKTQMAIAEASAQANARMKTRQAGRQEGMAMTDRASNALAGYPSMGMQATGAGAGYGAAGLATANMGLAGMNSGFGAAGGMAGQMGQNATNMYGAQANYKNSQDQIAASSDPFNAILGAATGVGMAAGIKKWG